MVDTTHHEEATTFAEAIVATHFDGVCRLLWHWYHHIKYLSLLNSTRAGYLSADSAERWACPRLVVD